MEEWQIIFGEVQSLIRNTWSLEQSLRQIISFARSKPTVFEEAEYWDRVDNHDFQAAFKTLSGWAAEGLAALGPETGWQFLLLDLGDCPDIFRLKSPGGQALMSEQKLAGVLASELVIHTSDIEGCFDPNSPDPFDQLFGEGRTALSAHHVGELGDSLLDWTNNPEPDFDGNSGYLLWLMLGTLALVEPLRDKSYCKAIHQGRGKLHLLSGYEEIFFYVGTVTPDGLLYDAP